MSKKLLSMLMGTTLAVSCLSGCGQTTNEPAESTGSVASTQEETPAQESSSEAQGGEETNQLMEDAGTTITLAHNQGEYIYESFYAMGDKFTELTGITIDWIEVPSSDWDTWITAQFAAGTEPDIIWSITDAKDYFDQGRIVDLTEYYQQENLFNGTKWIDGFTDRALDNALSNDGQKYIGTALTYATANLYYNVDAMEELGLGTTPPQNYTELFSMMETAKEDGTYIPMSVMNSMGWNLTWIEDDFADALFADTDYVEKLDIIVPNGYLDDSELMLGLKSGVLQYTDPRYVEYFRIMKEFSQYWNKDFNSASWEYEGLFNDGKVLFNFNGGWYPSQVVQNGYTVNYGTSARPYVDDEISEYGIGQAIQYASPKGDAGMHISTKCEEEGRLSAALKWLMFITDAETGAQMYTDAVMLMPCVKGVELPSSMAELANVEYGDAEPSKIIRAFKYNSEVESAYWNAYSTYLDPATNQSPEDFVTDMEDLLMPYLDEAIEEYTTYDILSYVDQVQ